MSLVIFRACDSVGGLARGRRRLRQSMWPRSTSGGQPAGRSNRGRRNGSLTREEYYRLEQGQNRIENYERREERADGVVTGRNASDSTTCSIARVARFIVRRTTASAPGGAIRNGRNGRHGGWTQGEHNGLGRQSAARHRASRCARRASYRQRPAGRFADPGRGKSPAAPAEPDRPLPKAAPAPTATSRRVSATRINTMQNQQSRDITGNARHNDPDGAGRRALSRPDRAMGRRRLAISASTPDVDLHAGSGHAAIGWQSDLGATTAAGACARWGARRLTAAPTMTRTTAPSGGGGGTQVSFIRGSRGWPRSTTRRSPPKPARFGLLPRISRSSLPDGERNSRARTRSCRDA